MKIASWNVNSINVRLPHILQWLQNEPMDVLALQETKVPDERFPEDALQEAGMHVVYCGEPKYNGVALISPHQIDDVQLGTPWGDPQMRLLAATINDVRVVNVYVPNGQSLDSDKYAYKLQWLEQLKNYMTQQLAEFSHCIVLGDFNIAPSDIDVHDPERWGDGILVSLSERQAFEQLLDLGLTDLLRELEPEKPCFTWWDYRMNAYRRKLGLRIDHLLVSTALAECAKQCMVDETPRAWERPSDHAPVWGHFHMT